MRLKNFIGLEVTPDSFSEMDASDFFDDATPVPPLRKFQDAAPLRLAFPTRERVTRPRQIR